MVNPIANTLLAALCARLGRFKATLLTPLLIVGFTIGGCRSATSTQAEAPAMPATSKAVFIDCMGSAVTVIYLCDGSAAMRPQLETVKRELAKSIGELDTDQSFDVIFFHDDIAVSLFDGVPQRSSGENKHKALVFVDSQQCSGTPQFRAAARLALAEKADLIYMLSPGLDTVADPDSILTMVTAASGQAHVNSIQFPLDTNSAPDDFMQKLARSGHGEFKMFRESTAGTSPSAPQ